MGALAVPVAIALAATAAPAQQTGGVASASAPSATLTVNDVLAVRTIAAGTGQIPTALAPDGGMVAYTVLDGRGQPPLQDPRYFRFGPTGVSAAAMGAQLWIADVASGKAVNPTEGRGTSWAPAWSPDGRRLAFYWDGDGAVRLWIWERATSRLRAASAAITRSFLGFDRARWTPDGRSLITKVLPESLTIEQAADLMVVPSSGAIEEMRRDSVTVTVFRARREARANNTEERPVTSVGWGNTYLSDLALIDVESGRTRRLARSAHITGHWVSPDVRRAAYMTLAGTPAASSQQLLFDLHVVDLSSGRSRVVAASIPQYYGVSVSWSPDGRWLGYTTASISLSNQIAGESIRGDVFLVSAEGGEPRNLTPGEHAYFGDDYRVPVWDEAGRFVYLIGNDTLWRVSLSGGKLAPVGSIRGRQMVDLVGRVGSGRLWSPDGGRTAYVAIADTVTRDEGIAAIHLRTGATRILFEEARNIEPHFGTEAGGGRVAYVAQDATHPTELWITDEHLRDRRPLTSVNPQLAGKAIGESRLVSWRGADGRRLHGALLLPAGYQPGRRYPLIVVVYGGSSGSRAVNTFGIRSSRSNMQLFASRGYAVLFPDTPLGLGTPVADLASTVVPAVDSLIASGLVDSARVGVFGHSYGGYSVLALLTETNRFRTGVSSAGMSDLFALYGALQTHGGAWAVAWAEEGQGRMGGTPWQYRDRYLENSPFFRLDRVNASVLLIHGSNDSAVPAFLAEQTFVALRRLGKEVTYARYEGEEHSQSYWGTANARDYLNRLVAWFDEQLAPEAAAVRVGTVP